MRIGSAIVSSVHANFIINEGGNNANEVLEVIKKMQQRVIEVHGVKLQQEVVIYTEDGCQ